MSRVSSKARGFSTVELLIVIGIVIALACLFFPAWKSVTLAAKRAACVNNMRQIGGAIFGYLGEHRSRFFPRGTPGESNNYISYIYPYLDDPGVYRCPSAVTPQTYTARTYMFNRTHVPEEGQAEGMLYDKRQPSILNPSQRIMVFDIGTTGKRKLFSQDTVDWTMQADQDEQAKVNYPRWHSSNNSAVNLLFVDGSVRFKKYPLPTEWYYPRSQ